MPDSTTTPTAPSMSTIVSGTDASHLGASTWSPSGKTLEGWLIFVLALPTGLTNQTPRLKGTDLEVPQRVAIPVVNGLFDTTTQVLYNASIEPPNSRYGLYFLSQTGNTFDLNADALVPFALQNINAATTYIQFQLTEAAAGTVSWPTL